MRQSFCKLATYYCTEFQHFPLSHFLQKKFSMYYIFHVGARNGIPFEMISLKLINLIYSLGLAVVSGRVTVE